MDYWHMSYQCPYLSGTTENRIYCDGNCRIQFSTVADCREFLRSYCANQDQHWKDCCIAQSKTRRIEKNEEIKKEIREWRNKETRRKT